jgi:hypothetical protein
MGRVSGVTGRLQGPAAVQQRGRTHRQEPCCVDIQERDRQCLDRTESLANQIGGRKVSEGDGQQTAEGVTHALIGCEEELPLRSRGWGVEGGRAGWGRTVCRVRRARHFGRGLSRQWPIWQIGDAAAPAAPPAGCVSSHEAARTAYPPCTCRELGRRNIPCTLTVGAPDGKATNGCAVNVKVMRAPAVAVQTVEPRT